MAAKMTFWRQPDAPERRSVIEAGLRNTARLLVLINDLLNLARLDSGRATPEKRCIDLAAVIRQVAANFESGERARRIALQGVETVVAAEVDARQMKEVLYNLLSNAFKFTPAGGLVTLSAYQEDDMIVFEVTDTGTGIPAADLDLIFDRFYQAESNPSRRHKGTGLGLALVKEIVDAHQGAVAVTSALGEGTTFTVTLPTVGALALLKRHA